LHSACRQLREWHLLDDSLGELSVHVNVSGHDVVQRGLPGRVCAAIEDAQLQPRHLTLELPENVLVERLEAALPTLNELREVGVGLSLDDFGTGYSSLRHLSALPVSSLKIDRCFVQELQRGSGDVAVLRAIVSLATSLGKSIIAEGIETAAQIAQLRRLGCAAGQGYYLARPLSASQIGKMLAGSVASARARETIERVAADMQAH